MSQLYAQSPANPRAVLLLSLAAGLVTLTLLSPLMSWVVLLMMCSLGIRTVVFFRPLNRAMNTRLINLLGVLVCLALAWSATRHGLLEMMVNLLICGCALKLLLLRRPKEVVQLAGCILFLAGCALVFDQALAVALGSGLVVMTVLLCLHQFYAPQQAFKRQLSKAMVLALQALPIALLLFFITPQLPPLWGMPAEQQAQTGLSDSLTPGDVANLTRSTDRVFTATFDGPVPPPAQRYWRALVLEQFDGKTWQVSDYRRQQPFTASPAASPAPVAFADTVPLPYTLMMEATGNHYLYGLGLTRPASIDTARKISQQPTYTLRAQQPLAGKQAFTLVGYPQAPRVMTNRALDAVLNVQVPDNGSNPQTRAWAASLRARYAEDSALAQAVMQYFARQSFAYTLTPPTMPQHPVDTFLFDARQGFCAHYASAMAYVMRLAGVPARIVSGYQGGEAISDGALAIYQYDAHAWVEVAVDGQHWQRYDPTAMVAASRLQYGFRQALASQQTDQPFFSRSRIGEYAWLGSMYALLDGVNYQWNRWVLGFDAEQQQDLISDIVGEPSTSRVFVLGLTVMAFIAGLLVLYFMPRPKRHRGSAADQLFRQVEQVVAKRLGLKRQFGSARQFIQAARQQVDSATATELDLFLHLFEQVVYQPQSRPKYRLQQLKIQQKRVLAACRTLRRTPPSETTASSHTQT